MACLALSLASSCKVIHTVYLILPSVLHGKVDQKLVNSLHRLVDQKLVNSLHRLLTCKIDGLDCPVITTEYRTCVHCIHMLHVFCSPCNLFQSVRSMFSCYRYTQTVHFYHIQAHVDQVHTKEIWTQLNHVLHTYKQSRFFLDKILYITDDKVSICSTSCGKSLNLLLAVRRQYCYMAKITHCKLLVY